MKINATNAKTVTLACKDGNHCDKIDVYCPYHNDTSFVNCFVETQGMDNHGLQIYSKNGFDTFSYKKNGNFTELMSMFCDDNYGTTCEFREEKCDVDEWKCNSKVPNPTHKPTNNPIPFQEELTQDMFECVGHHKQPGSIVYINQHLICQNNDNICNFNCARGACCQLSMLECQDDKDCNIGCYHTDSCNSATINCPNNADCNVYCNGTLSCSSTTINCPENGNCNVICRHPDACYKTKIDCKDESKCSLTCENGNNAKPSCPLTEICSREGKSLNVSCLDGGFCKDVNMYCPNDDSQVNCYLSATGDNNKNITVHAKNGFDTFQYSVASNISINETTLICGDKSDEICDNILIDSKICEDEWICNSNVPNPTLPPTKKPTQYSSKTIVRKSHNCSVQFEYQNHDLQCPSHDPNPNVPCLFDCTQKDCCRADHINCAVC